jgi:hypothetical protein
MTNKQYDCIVDGHFFGDADECVMCGNPYTDKNDVINYVAERIWLVNNPRSVDADIWDQPDSIQNLYLDTSHKIVEYIKSTS